MIDHSNVEFLHDSMIFVYVRIYVYTVHFFTSYSEINMIYEVCFKLRTHISNDYKIYVNAQKKILNVLIVQNFD